MRNLLLTPLFGLLVGCNSLGLVKEGASHECYAPDGGEYAADAQKEIHVKAPPQKIVVDLPPGTTHADFASEGAGEGEGRPAAASANLAPAAYNQAAQAAGFQSQTNALLPGGGLTQVSAITSPLATPRGGGMGLGIGLGIIEIPVPVPRFFRVREEPTLNIPLSQAQIIAAGGMGTATGMPVMPGAAGIPGLAMQQHANQVSQQEMAELMAALKLIQQQRASKSQVSQPAAAADTSTQDVKALEEQVQELEKAKAELEKMKNQLDEAVKKLEKAPAPK
jgi:hypothetical protein